MSKTPLRLAVLGLGKAGIRHVEAAKAIDDVELVAVADNSAEARENIDIKGTSCRVRKDLDGLLDVGTDAMIIALPHGLLAEAAIRVARAGVHMLLEKPMANTLEDGQRIVAEADSNGVRLMVNFNHRFRDEYQHAKRWLEEGRIGQIRFLLEEMFASRGPLPSWVWDPKIAGGGMMTYSGIHMLDHAMWLTGKRVESVSASMGSFQYEESLEDTTVASLRLQRGSLVTLIQHKSNVNHSQATWETRIQGSEGAIHVVAGEGAYLSGTRGEEEFKSGAEQRFIRALEEFAASVREQRAPSSDGVSALSVLSCLKALYQAQDCGEWVSPEYV